MKAQVFIVLMLFASLVTVAHSVQTQKVANSIVLIVVKIIPYVYFICQQNYYIFSPALGLFSSKRSTRHYRKSWPWPGPYGRDGAKGEKGEIVSKGAKGGVGAQAPSNWKPCVWRREDGQEGEGQRFDTGRWIKPKSTARPFLPDFMISKVFNFVYSMVK